MGDWALLFDYKFKKFKGKFNTYCLGPYEVEEVFDNRNVKINTIHDGKETFLVNGNILKLYQNPKSKEEYFIGIVEKSDMEIVDGGMSLMMFLLNYLFKLTYFRLLVQPFCCH